MSEIMNPERKKQIIKDIIQQLHQGLSVEAARDILVKEVGSITSSEIAEIEQSLINEGMSTEVIKKFCNVHALLFESLLKREIINEESTAHPVHLFKLENREIEKILSELKQQVRNGDKEGIKKSIIKLKDIDIHYKRKEQLLFPFLEKYGFFGPSKVMWGKDNEIRDMLKNALTKIEVDIIYLNSLIEEIEGMIFKEENILFPISLEKLKLEDWIEILKESKDVGYIFIEPPKDIDTLINELKTAVIEEPVIKDEVINFPTGNLSPKELMFILNTLPVDITFIDENDNVKYFSGGRDRIFLRTKSVIGRKVQNCHPPQSVDKVEKILSDFKEGKKDSVSFWINYKGRYIYIKYFAVRDHNKKYLGTLEVTQNITEIKKLDGEKRLLDEGT